MKNKTSQSQSKKTEKTSGPSGNPEAEEKHPDKKTANVTETPAKNRHIKAGQDESAKQVAKSQQKKQTDKSKGKSKKNDKKTKHPKSKNQKLHTFQVKKNPFHIAPNLTEADKKYTS